MSKEQEKTKIFLSDPQVLFREGIHFILSGEDDFEVIGEATGNEDTLARIEANPPHIVILNIADKKLSGLEAVHLIKKQYPTVSAVLTIDDKDEAQLFEVIRGGASAYLTKDTDPERLLDTIRDVSQGGLPIVKELLMPAMAARVLAEFENFKSLGEGMGTLMAGLAPTETQILNSIAAGNDITPVAARLNMDEDSIRNILKLVLNKLAANDRTRAIVIAVQRSLSSMMATAGRSGTATGEYLTQEEFARFKDSLAKRLRDVAGKAF
jgi:two-component system NarL family response regulator